MNAAWSNGVPVAGRDVVVRPASLVEDWSRLSIAYRNVYRADHPLLDRTFWEWRFGDDRYGVAMVAVAGDAVVGHVGAALNDGVAWIINVFVDPEFRGQGLLGRLYGAASDFGTLAATNVNRAGTDMYRRMGWYRHADLERYVAWNRDIDPTAIVEPVDRADTGWSSAPDQHFWRQPTMRGLTAPDGSLVVDQRDRGGMRVIDLGDAESLPELAFSTGARWVDYVTSWNDPVCRDLDRLGWVLDEHSPVPWLLSPVVATSRARVNVFSASPTAFAADRVITRAESDHGRVGSIPAGTA